MTADDLERVTAMVTDHGQHWDLSENDEIAISAVLQSRAELLEVLEALAVDAEKAANPRARLFNYEQVRAVIRKAKGEKPSQSIGRSLEEKIS